MHTNSPVNLFRKCRVPSGCIVSRRRSNSIKHLLNSLFHWKFLKFHWKYNCTRKRRPPKTNEPSINSSQHVASILHSLILTVFPEHSEFKCFLKRLYWLSLCFPIAQPFSTINFNDFYLESFFPPPVNFEFFSIFLKKDCECRVWQCMFQFYNKTQDVHKTPHILYIRLICCRDPIEMIRKSQKQNYTENFAEFLFPICLYHLFCCMNSPHTIQRTTTKTGSFIIQLFNTF